MSLVLPVAAALATLFGLFLLYDSWKRPGRGPWLAGGWMILISACVAWTYANGDRGLAQGVCFAMLVTSGLIIMPAFRGMTPAKAAAVERSMSPGIAARTSVRGILSGFWVFLLVGPIAGTTAFYASAAGFRLFWNGVSSPATPAMLAIVSSVVLWALLSTLLLMERRPVLRTIYAISTCAIAVAAATF